MIVQVACWTLAGATLTGAWLRAHRYRQARTILQRGVNVFPHTVLPHPEDARWELNDEKETAFKIQAPDRITVIYVFQVPGGVHYVRVGRASRSIADLTQVVEATKLQARMYYEAVNRAWQDRHAQRLLTA